LKNIGRIASLALNVSIIALVGCGGVKSGQNLKTVQSAGQGTSTVSFAIPLSQPGSQFAGFTPHANLHPALSNPRAQFIDSSANGKIYLFVDQTQLPDPVDLGSVVWDNGVATWSGASSITDSFNNGSFSYTAGITGNALTVNLSLTATAGVSHTFGVIQTNGSCVGCLVPNPGYVLAEGVTSPFTLSTVDADNPGITLTLREVLQAGYICGHGDSNCSNNYAGTADSNGLFTLDVMPVDENGSSAMRVLQATAPTAPAGGWPTYDNGSWQIVVNDPQHVMQIDSTTPLSRTFSAVNPIQRPSGRWYDGQNLSFKCVGTGTATVSMQMVPSSASAGPVSGFTYTGNYPAAGAVLGGIGASGGSDQVYGNGEGTNLSCTAYGTVHIVVN
jgi:hypothetical protein